MASSQRDHAGLSGSGGGGQAEGGRQLTTHTRALSSPAAAASLCVEAASWLPAGCSVIGCCWAQAPATYRPGTRERGGRPGDWLHSARTLLRCVVWGLPAAACLAWFAASAEQFFSDRLELCGGSLLVLTLLCRLQDYRVQIE